MKKDKLPKRSEVPVEFTWNLKDIFEDDKAFEAALENAKAYPEKVGAFCGRLGESAETMLEFFKLQDEITIEISKIYGYASLKSDEDTSDGASQIMKGKAINLYVAISGAGAFATPEIISIPDETIAKFFDECKELEVYRRPIQVIRHSKDHVLSPECETILARAGEIAQGPETIGGILRNADMKYGEVADSQGNMHPLSSGTFVLLEESEDRVLRENAFKRCYGKYGELKNTLASILDAQFKQLVFFANTRKYNSTLEASLDRTEVPTLVYHNLIEAVHQNLDKMYRYVALRKKLLGVDELHMYDVYTPIVPDAAKEIDFETAKNTVKEALQVLGPDYIAILDEGFSNRWIDVYENEGKRSGAYSSGLSYPHPYVLLNHSGNLDSMFTLAHEMGHALHSYHSTKYQPTCTADYVIFVAEVASTVNEVLLMKHLLSITNDKKDRAYLINHFLEQFKGTVYRQTMFAEFELELGKMAESAETLTADALCAKYLELNKKYFGPDMISDDEISLEWARIPHFFYNYYVFQYATGFSAAVAIAERILSEGEPAVKAYKQFLSAGSSKDPISVLKIAGVDMSTPEPVNSGLKLFGELIGEMEELV
ncbi:MAG: oligoendopeptidase F [Desulfovibrionaceae bacterium]|nr:oligoendopeptidase F [Desulfovibrionaceae bacterium]